MHLPDRILPYMYGLIHLRRHATTTVLEFFAKMSHDYLTRQMKYCFNWRKTLFSFVDDVKNGDLIFDDTDINKSYAKKICKQRWLWSHKDKCNFFGYSLLLMLWRTKKGRNYPIMFKIYHQDMKGKKTRIDLTVELLNFAIHKLKLKPRYVLFDSFFSSQKILRWCDENKILFIGQVAKNRLLDNQQLQNILPDKDDWARSGNLKFKIRVKVTKHGRKYFITNDTKLTGKIMRKRYKQRWSIELVFKFAKNLGLEKCQMRDLRSQTNHFWICFILYCLFQDTAHNTGLTKEAIRERIILTRQPQQFALFKTTFAMFA